MADLSQPASISLAMIRESLSTALVCDALDSLGLREQSPRLAWPVKTTAGVLVGRCKTTLWSERTTADSHPYEKELLAVDTCQPDQVMIAAAGGSLRSGLWGELLSTAARNSGCVGAIVDGAVRDVAQMTEMQFPVFSKAISAKGTVKSTLGSVNIPVVCAGVHVNPGDVVIADADGVVIVPAGIAQQAADAAEAREANEGEKRAKLAKGVLGLDMYNMRGPLEKAGLKYID